MKPYKAAAIVVLAPLFVSAEVRKPCEALKAEITKKIEANKASAYWLEIVDKDKQKDGAVVGRCEGDTKVIVYHRGAPPEQSPSKTPAKPQAE
jgi:hypothetical protein